MIIFIPALFLKAGKRLLIRFLVARRNDSLLVLRLQGKKRLIKSPVAVVRYVLLGFLLQECEVIC